MYEIRWHARAGQGAVTAAKALADAALAEGKYIQAFPDYGPERMGAPVTAFCRIDNQEIRLRDPVMHPHALIIQDPTLLHQIDLFSGLDPNGFILVNSTRSFEELGIGEFAGCFPEHHIRAVAATEFALKHIGRPLPNAALLGGFAAMCGQIGFDSIAVAIGEKFPGKIGEMNIAAAREAFEFVNGTRRGPAPDA